MDKKLRFSDVPADWGGHLPDGDYSVGPGADPRGQRDRQRKSSAKKSRRSSKIVSVAAKALKTPRAVSKEDIKLLAEAALTQNPYKKVVRKKRAT